MDEILVMTDEGTQNWYKDGLPHRDNAPAVIFRNGTLVWYKQGKVHREDGPAIMYGDGQTIWMVNGVEVKKEQVLNTPEKLRVWKVEETIRKL